MPYPNEHSARLRDPKDFDPKSFRRTKGGTIYGKIKVPKTIGIIWGKLKGKNKPSDPPIPQALRFPVKYWTADEAKQWLKDNNVKYIAFEPAAEEDSMPTDVLERRCGLNLEIRQEPSDDRPRLVGYAALFNVMSDDLGGFREVILPGAFKRSLESGDDVRALVDHDPSKILGRVKAGTLKLEEDDKGLRVEIIPPDTSIGRDVIESVRRGDLDQMSFAFRTVKDAWRTENGESIRELHEVKLFDVSIVTFPAYPQTEVALRSLERWRHETNGGISISFAKRRLALAEREIGGI